MTSMRGRVGAYYARLASELVKQTPVLLEAETWKGLMPFIPTRGKSAEGVRTRLSKVASGET